MPRKILMSEARVEFGNHLVARGLRPATVKNNTQVLNRWVDLVGDTRIDLINATHLDVFFGKGGWAAQTQNLYLSLLRGTFFPWCRRHQYMPRDYDPTEGWRSVRVDARDQFWLPVNEFPALLDAASNKRDRAIIAIGLYTFLRGGEISTLRLQDVDFDSHTLRIQRHKTKQVDVLPMATELAEELDDWLREYKRLMVFTLQPDWFLVPAKLPLPMAWHPQMRMLQPTGVEAPLKPTVPMGKPYNCVKRALRKLNYEVVGTGVHTLRRSGARGLFDRLRSEGYDGALMRVSSMLGHADTKTTERYLGLGIERQQRNELLAGKLMFPDLRKPATVIQIKEAPGGNRV